MSEDTKASVEVSDAMIRRFLLGGLNSAEQPAFEQRLFSDEDLEARVRRAEYALADDYAYDRLNQIERDLFDRKFLVSADRRGKAEVSKVLRERFAPASVANSKAGLVERFRSLFTIKLPAWRWAFGAVLLLILLGTALLVTKEPRLPQQIVRKLIPRRSPRSEPKEASHPINNSSPQHQETPAPMPPHDQSSSSTLTVALSADRAEPAIVNVPRGAQDVVHFQLAMPADQSGPYRAELLTIEGQHVFTAEFLKDPGAGAPVDFEVGAASLKPGNYQIKLTRDNGGVKEGVGNYRFGVQ
jgi:hypothetical protein